MKLTNYKKVKNNQIRKERFFNTKAKATGNHKLRFYLEKDKTGLITDFSGEHRVLTKILVNRSKKRASELNNSKTILTVLSFIGVLLSIIFFTFYYFRFLDLSEMGIKDLNFFDPIRYITSGVFSKNELEGIKNEGGRTNILLVGVDARGNNDSWLTDTIMLLSYKHSDNSLISISIPRDLMVRYNNVYVKINSIFPYTIQSERSVDKKANLDFILNKAFENLFSIIKEIIGLTPHYGVLINFNGFRSIIDAIGGIDVYVERSFVDYEFPNYYDTGYITVSFKEGWERMNGERALQYVRSRKGNNGEGTDYARAKRQQNVLKAIKEKIISSNIWVRLDKLDEIMKILSNNLRFHGVSSSELNSAIQSRKLLETITISGFVISPELGSYVGHILKGGEISEELGWVVYPVDKNYAKLQKCVLFYIDNADLIRENPKVIVIFTNSKARSSFLQIVKLLQDNFLKFEQLDYLISLEEDDNTNRETNKNFVNFYVRDQNTKSFRVYANVIDDKYQINYKDYENIRKSLKKMREEYDLIIAVN